jgi:anti-sigma factor RsiW
MGCGRYRKLHYAARDRSLSDRELEFLERHETACPECAKSMRHATDALDFLRMSALEPETTTNFNDRILRRHKVESVRASVRYWSPAMLGAVAAGLTLLAAMQMIAQSSHLPIFKVPASEARLTSPAIPSLDRLNLQSSWQ